MTKGDDYPIKPEQGPVDEIERKFIIDQLPPELDLGEPEHITQGYVLVKDNREKRVRQKGERYFYTVKTGQGRKRKEDEREITKEEFDHYWSFTGGAQINKDRYKVEFNGRVIEVDVFSGENQGLVLAEVEFPDDSSADEFVPPDWFGVEVTEDSRYKNKNLAR